MFSMQTAIANQYACQSIIEADKQFEISCEKCCNSPKCLHMDCDRCKVKQMHDYVIEMLKENINVKEVA